MYLIVSVVSLLVFVPAPYVDFIDDMAAHLAACDVIVCRAGAVTVSELCAAGDVAVTADIPSDAVRM